MSKRGVEKTRPGAKTQGGRTILRSVTRPGLAQIHGGQTMEGAWAGKQKVQKRSLLLKRGPEKREASGCRIPLRIGRTVKEIETTLLHLRRRTNLKAQPQQTTTLSSAATSRVNRKRTGGRKQEKRGARKMKQAAKNRSISIRNKDRSPPRSNAAEDQPNEVRGIHGVECVGADVFLGGRLSSRNLKRKSNKYAVWILLCGLCRATVWGGRKTSPGLPGRSSLGRD